MSRARQKNRQTRQATPTCPSCGSKSVVPIFWGYPAADSMQPLLDAVHRGEIVLGGCGGDATGNRPPWYCKNCQNRWGER